MDDEEEWVPDEGVGEEEEEEEEEEDGGEKEARDSLAELGNRQVGDEMDTIARTADHGYYLRSLHKSGAYSGPKTATQGL